MSKNNPTFLVPILLLLVAMFSIQSGASLAKSIFEVAGPIQVTVLRVTLGMSILMVILRPWRYRSRWVLSKKNILMLIGYGLSLTTMNLLFYLALPRVPLGIVVAFEFTGPLLVAFCASRKLADFLWIFLAMIGLYFLLPINQNISDVDPLGAFYALAAGGCWALYIIFGKRAGIAFGTSAVALGTLIGTIAILPLGIIHSGAALFSPSLLPIAACIALLSTAIPYLLEMSALTQLPTKSFGTLMSLEPVMGALCGFIFLHEVLTLYQWLALSAIVSASVGAALTIKPATKIDKVE